MRKSIIISLLLLSCGASSFSQNQVQGTSTPYGPQPEPGKSMPDFTLDNIAWYKTPYASLKDFKGKWIIMDFWTTSCAPCIKAFPEVNELQKTFKDDIQFILVGKLDKNKQIERVYEKYQQKFDLQLASAYDSVLFARWRILSVPFIIIINPQGIVKAITSGKEMQEEKLRDMVSGKNVSFRSKNAGKPEYDIETFPGSEDNTLVYRSILTRGNGEQSTRSVPNEYTNELPREGLKFVMQPLEKLYLSAYLGGADWKSLAKEMKYPYIVLEVSDSGLFEFDYNTPDFKGLYNYNLAVPATKLKDYNFFLKTFQQELKNAFGFEAVVENRSVPVWKLTAKPGTAEKLRTKGTIIKQGGSPIGIPLINQPVSRLIKIIYSYHQGDFPIIDETGIEHNIDIKIEALMTDLEDIRKSLQKNGLDLVKAEKEMKVLVIRDPKIVNN